MCMVYGVVARGDRFYNQSIANLGLSWRLREVDQVDVLFRTGFVGDEFRAESPAKRAGGRLSLASSTDCGPVSGAAASGLHLMTGIERTLTASARVFHERQ